MSLRDLLFHEEPGIQVYLGDCLEVMAALPEASVDAIVTDPPYGLEFMGKEWDRLDAGLPQESVWKGRRGQGGSKVGGDDTRPSSRHHVAYGVKRSGFRRCNLCGKRQFSGSPCECPESEWSIEYPDGAPSSAIRMQRWHEQWARQAYRVLKPGAHLLAFGGTRTFHRLTCALEDAGFEIRDCLMWLYGSGFPKSKNIGGGWGTALKPAWEPIVLARKPLGEANVAANAQKHGTGAINVDGCRVPGPKGDGRWPANLLLDEAAAAQLDEQSGELKSGDCPNGFTGPYKAEVYGRYARNEIRPATVYADSGGASRFFYTAKADREDRDGSKHPTVKPVDLMKWLVRLITPPGGLIVDCFMGSGPTIYTARELGFRAIGIDREAEYCRDAVKRLRQGVLPL